MNDLLEEYSVWYQNLARDHGRLPNTISGISADGNQFIFILDGLSLNHVDKNNFIITILTIERSETFMYGTLFGVYNEETDEILEELSISVGTTRSAIENKWSVDRVSGEVPKLIFKDKYRRDSPQDYPNMWFLTGLKKVSDSDYKRFEKLWSEVQDQVRRQSRN